jgi:hypothetical protein
MPVRTPLAVVLLCTVAIGAACTTATTPEGAPRRARGREITLPDADAGVAPVRPAERARAIRAALAAPAVRDRIAGTRFRVVAVERAAPYERHAACAGCIVVTIYSYARDGVLAVTVSPRGLEVRRVARGGARPPLSAAERREVHRLAEGDREVRAMLGASPHAHPALASPLWPDGGPCDRHRCASVVFLLDGIARSGIGRQLHVLVDLSRRTILGRKPLTCDPECRVGW